MSTVLAANATILVNPLDGNPFSTKGRGDDLENLETEAQLIRSNDVARMVQKREGTATPIAEILGGLEVSVPPNTQILEIDYSSRSSILSLSRAQWFAEEYLAYRELRAKSLVASQTKRLEEQIAARGKEQSAFAKQLNRADPGSTQAGVLRVQLEAVSTQINQLRARSAELQSVSSNPGQIVTPAAIPPAGLLGSWLAYALAGLIGGLSIAVFIALLRSRADNRIRHVDDVATAGQVLLGAISTNDAVDARMIFKGAGSAGDLPRTFRDLRVSLLTTEHRRPAVIVVTTARHDDEPPSSIAGLALATATGNLRTVVVETTASHFLPKDSEHANLADVLSGRIMVASALVHVRPHLDVLAGDDTLSVDDLFMAPQMHALVDSLRDTADIVFISTNNIHDARSKALIDLADSVILEVVQGVSSYRDLYHASNDYALVADKLLGVVYVARSVSRGRGAGSSARPTDRPVQDPWEQAAKRTAIDSQLDADTTSMPVVGVAPNRAIGSDDRRGHSARPAAESTDTPVHDTSAIDPELKADTAIMPVVDVALNAGIGSDERRGHSARPAAEHTDIPVRDTPEQRSPDITTAIDSELEADTDIMPVVVVALDGGIGSDERRGHSARPAAEHTDTPVEQGLPDHTTATDSELEADTRITPVGNGAPDPVIEFDDQIYDLPPWANGAVRQMVAYDQATPSIRDGDLAAARRGGR